MGLRQPGFSRVGFRRVSAATGGGASGSTSADLAATAWFVDPQNSSGVASDGNTGYTSGAPLLTLNKLFTRMGTTNGQSVAITLMSSDNLANPRPINRYIPLGNNALSITGTPTVIYSSTVTGWASAANAPTATDNELTDAAVPGGSWTAAGALISGRLIKRTNSTVVYGVPMKDLGTNKLRISTPSTGDGSTYAALVAADTYQLISLPVIGDIYAASTLQSLIFIPSVQITTCDVQMTLPNSTFQFSNCTQSAGTLACIGNVYQNMGFNVAGGVSWQGGAPLSLLTFAPATFRGNAGGTRIYTFSGPAININFSGPSFAQGASLTLSANIFAIYNQAVTTPNNGIYVYDSTASACVRCLYWSLFYFFGAGLGGSGNTTALIAAGKWSQVAYAATPVGAGQTSAVGAELLVGAVSHPIADLPILVTSEENGIFITE
jgi:hypothetical protein